MPPPRRLPRSDRPHPTPSRALHGELSTGAGGSCKLAARPSCPAGSTRPAVCSPPPRHRPATDVQLKPGAVGGSAERFRLAVMVNPASGGIEPRRCARSPVSRRQDVGCRLLRAGLQTLPVPTTLCPERRGSRLLMGKTASVLTREGRASCKGASSRPSRSSGPTRPIDAAMTQRHDSARDGPVTLGTSSVSHLGAAPSSRVTSLGVPRVVRALMTSRGVPLCLGGPGSALWEQNRYREAGGREM